MTSEYMINEAFYSLQGEGMRAGTANIFLRFTGCNMRCDLAVSDKSPGGFKCDTEFTSGRKMSLSAIHAFIKEIAPDCKWIILTGGEPCLQVDQQFIDYFHSNGYQLAIETNGSMQVPEGIDWITVSPKVAEHAIVQKEAHEVKYVRGYGQAIPKTKMEADFYLISPAFDGLDMDPKALNWCIQLVRENPLWRLSVQQHKGWKAR